MTKACRSSRTRCSTPSCEKNGWRDDYGTEHSAARAVAALPDNAEASVEEARDAFFAARARDGLANQRSDRDDADIFRGFDGFGRQYRVCDDERLQPRVLNATHRAPRQHCVRDVG